MALTAWPFADTDTTEAQYGDLFAGLQDDGIVGVPGDTDGGVSPASGLTVRVAAFGLAYLAGTVVTSDAPTDVTLAAAGSGSRVDRIVLRIDAGNTISITRLTGVNASTAAPTVTQDPGGVYELPLARIAVAAGATNVIAANITDERPWVSTRVGKWTTATRPGTPGQRPVRRGDLGFNFTTGTWEGWNGSSWAGLGGGNGSGTIQVFNPTTGSYQPLTGDFFIGNTAPSTGVNDGDVWLTTV